MPGVINPEARLLLTSAGSTTEVIQENLRELAQQADKPRETHILRIDDGWTAFGSTSGTTPSERFRQSIDASAAWVWSNHCLKYVLGRATVIQTVHAAKTPKRSFNDLLRNADLLVVPGGNTYQTINGLSRHADAIKYYVGKGLSYIGESAGSIVAGRTLQPADLKPADAQPVLKYSTGENGLSLVDADIVTHAHGRVGGFAVHSLLSAVAGRVLKRLETPQAVVDAYVARRQREGIITYVLNDKQALLVANGIITPI